MKKILVALFLSLSLHAVDVQVDFHIIDGTLFFPKDDSGYAGNIIADQLYIKSPDVIISMDTSDEILKADLILDSRYIFFDTPFAKIAAGIGDLGPLYEDINNLVVNDTYFIYDDRQILLSTNKFDLSYGKALVDASNTTLSCDNFSEKKSFTKETAFVDCLNRAKLETKDESLGPSIVELEVDDYVVTFDMNDAVVGDGGLHLDTNKISLQKGDNRYIFTNLETYCSKEDNFQELVPSAFLSGCFKESYLTLSKFEMITPKVELVSNVELINIAGSRLRLSLPTTIIKSNDDITTIHNVRIGCKSLIQDMDDLNISTLVNGCLESSAINATALSSASIERKMREQQALIKNGTAKQVNSVQKSSKGFGIDDFSLLEVTSKAGQITLLGKVKLLFLNPEFKVTGEASFNEADSQIIVDVDKVLFAGFIPVKKLVLYLLKKFIPEGNISIDGETIKVNI